jgi:hypothetical protein
MVPGSSPGRLTIPITLVEQVLTETKRILYDCIEIDLFGTFAVDVVFGTRAA